MWINKKKLQETTQLMSEQRQLIEDQNDTIASLLSLVQRAREEVAGWRNKYELALLTPEHKADVEAAQNRGAEHFKKKLIAFLMSDVELRHELPQVKLPKNKVQKKEKK